MLSTIRQSEFRIALLVLKYVFGYSVVLCKVKQKKSINFLEAVNIAQDIANELKCLREKAEYEFHQLYIFAQETAKAEDFILKIPRLTSRPVMALEKGGPGARKVRGGHYFLSQKKVAKPGFGV